MGGCRRDNLAVTRCARRTDLTGKKNKQKADDEKKRADEAEKQKQQQHLVVKEPKNTRASS
jgi:hypothetical protein